MTYGNNVLILIALAASPLPANAQEQYASAKPTIIPPNIGVQRNASKKD